jgi:hypothetical protein
VQNEFKIVYRFYMPYKFCGPYDLTASYLSATKFLTIALYFSYITRHEVKCVCNSSLLIYLPHSQLKGARGPPCKLLLA